MIDFGLETFTKSHGKSHDSTVGVNSEKADCKSQTSRHKPDINYLNCTSKRQNTAAVYVPLQSGQFAAAVCGNDLYIGCKLNDQI